MKQLRIFIALFLLAVLCSAVYSCVKESQVTKVELSDKLITISEGDTQRLSYKVLPEEMEQTAKWKSLNSEIATITSDGLVTGISGGITYVTATSGAITEGCKVIVVAHVSGVKLNMHQAMIERDGVFQLIPEIIPSTAYNKDVTWKSTAPKIAYVGNGVVSGISVGKADIVVTTVEGGFTDTCHVEVISSVKEVKLDKSSAKINKGEELTLTATVLPEDATYKEIVWKSDDESVATVDENGVVTGVGRGNCTVTATSAQSTSISASCEIEVYVPVTGVEMLKEKDTLYVGDRKFLKAQVLPLDANNQSVSWTSSATAYAKVVLATGLVTAVKEGSATITVTTTEGKFKDVCELWIIQGTEAVTGVELDQSSLRMRIGNSYELYAKVLPVNAANKGITWSSDNTAVASVDTNGKITAKDAGQCVIKATTKDGGFTATCTVKVVGFDAPVSDGLDDNTYIWQK